MHGVPKEVYTSKKSGMDQNSNQVSVFLEHFCFNTLDLQMSVDSSGGLSGEAREARPP